MEKSFKRGVVIIILFLFAGMNFIYAQQKSVTGKITDAENIPLPGVTVVVKGTTVGTVTNNDGAYNINVPDENATLVFSFIGMKTQEILVEGKTSIDLVLESATIGIEEVVAIGYGTQNRQEITGAVSVADLEKYRDVPVNNVLETVKGTIPGLVVGSTNSAGAEAGLLIRGQNSQGASNKPLIVVDDVIYYGSLNDIAPEDINNFTVLKDASAAAIYGSRSANGVILIETKKGKGINGKAKFDVGLTYGITTQLKPVEVYDAEGYLDRMVDLRNYLGLETDVDDLGVYMTPYEQENYYATPDHKPTVEDPFSLIGQMGNSKRINISMSNNTGGTNYYIAVSGVDQEGVLVGDEYKNATARVNLSTDITDWFHLGIKSFYSFKDYSGDSPPLDGAVSFSPWAKLYREDGRHEQFPNETTSFQSPFWRIRTKNYDVDHQLNGMVNAVFKIPGVEGLKYTLNLSKSMRWSENSWFSDEFTRLGQTLNGDGGRSFSRGVNTLADNIVSYKRTFADKHKVGATLLYSYEGYNSESVSATASGFDNAVLMDYKLENGGTQNVNTGGGEWNALGMMARLNYSFDDRYSITGTMRRDGYSAFSKNKKWANFSSVGLNWNVTNESFMENVGVLNNLSLRASYGSNGNQSISPYQTLAKVGTGKYVLNPANTYSFTQYVSSMALNDLGWETTTGTNLGIDFGLWNNRLSGSLEAYATSTTDLIFDLNLPRVTGFGSIKSNIGEIQNKGFELSLSGDVINKTDFQWNANFVFSLNRNKVVTIYGDDLDEDGVEDDLISSNIFIGEPLGMIYYYNVLGIYQQSDEDNGTIMEGQRPGDYIIEDLPTEENPEGDGKINADDRQFIGQQQPNFRWSLTNSFTYKDFSLMVYLYSIWGGDDYYKGADAPWNHPYVYRTDINSSVYDYWTPENTGAEFPRLDYQGRARYKIAKYYDRSFIKLQKLALSYNMDRLVQPVGINGMKLTFSADNLFVYAPHWIGLDPETGQGLGRSARPSMRTYLFSLSFNF